MANISILVARKNLRIKDHVAVFMFKPILDVFEVLRPFEPTWQLTMITVNADAIPRGL